MFQVRHVGKISLAEPQDGESAQDGVTAQAGRDDLQREVLPAAEAEQVAKLVEHDFLASHRPPQRGLLDDRPELEPSLGEPALPFLAQDDVPLGLADRDVAEPEHGGRVLLRLQQAWYQLRLVHADRGRGLFHPDVGLEPVRQDVVVPVPPAGPVGLLGQAQQLLSLDRADAVEGEQVEHVDLADSVPAQLDAADLGLRAADGAGRGLGRDAPAFPKPPQLGAQQDAQHGGPLCQLGHGPSRIVFSPRNCLTQLRRKSLPSIFRNFHGISHGIARHPQYWGPAGLSWTQLSPDSCVGPGTLMTGHAGVRARRGVGRLARQAGPADYGARALRSCRWDMHAAPGPGAPSARIYDQPWAGYGRKETRRR